MIAHLDRCGATTCSRFSRAVVVVSARTPPRAPPRGSMLRSLAMRASPMLSRAVTSAARLSSSRGSHVRVSPATPSSRRGVAAAASAERAVEPGPPPHAALVTFSRSAGGAPELGLVENGEWLWTVSGKAYPRGMIDLVRALHDANLTPAEILERERRGDPIPLSSVTLLAPIPAPPSVVCVGKNYLEHVGEVDTNLPGISKAEAPSVPIIFTKAPTSVVGHRGGIIFPTGVTEEVDYEGELGVVIGRAGKAISREDALDHVFGYTVVNDVTARDVQKRHQQWYLGKSFDTFCPMGPWIVPKRGVQDPQALEIGTTVNGERRQGSDTSKMIFDIRELVAVASRCMTLQPGDVIATGTPAGVGAGMNPKGWLRVGDTCEVTIRGVGTLSNTVVEEGEGAR